MAIPDSLRGLAGDWTATYRLYEAASVAAQEPASTVSVTPAAGGRFLRIDYTWTYQNKPQEGSLLIGCDGTGKPAHAVWIDSWHMSDAFMIIKGLITTAQALDVRGSYPAPPGPDWGWRTVIEPRGPNVFDMVMWNITPDGREEIAVEAEYSRIRKEYEPGVRD